MYSNSPQSAYNGMMSGHRNMFLLSSVGIAMVGFVKDKSKVFSFIAFTIFIFAAIIGIKSSLDFDEYIKRNNFPKESYNYESWKSWKYLGFAFAIFLIILGIYSIMHMFVSI